MARCGLSEAQLIQLADHMTGTRKNLIPEVGILFGREVSKQVFLRRVDGGEAVSTEIADLLSKLLGTKGVAIPKVYAMDDMKVILFTKEFGDYVERCFACGLFGTPESLVQIDHPHAMTEHDQAYLCTECDERLAREMDDDDKESWQ